MYTACTHPTVKKQVLDDFVPRTQSYEWWLSQLLSVLGWIVQICEEWSTEVLRKTSKCICRRQIELDMIRCHQQLSILYNIPRVQHVQASMQEYTPNKEYCRRMMLLKDFNGNEELGTSLPDALCSCFMWAFFCIHHVYLLCTVPTVQDKLNDALECVHVTFLCRRRMVTHIQVRHRQIAAFAVGLFLGCFAVYAWHKHTTSAWHRMLG